MRQDFNPRLHVREEGGEVTLKQVAELVPEQYWDENVKKSKESMKDIPVADPQKDLKGIDGLIVGTPTRFGNMTSQMRNFWDQTGGDWMEGTLIGKPAAIVTSTGTQHGRRGQRRESRGLPTSSTKAWVRSDKACNRPC